MGQTGDAIRDEILNWPEVTAAQHRFGGVEFRFHGSELGHLHGDRLADLPFPRRIRDELVAAGRAAPHHVLPESGWVSVRIRGPEDVPAVVALFRMQYDRLAARRQRSAS
ncbi:MAG TPA: luciferase family protein [bacterium]|nr:luciferase family protein [bacterium]